MNTRIRVIGTGNAWPVLIGGEHSFYNRKNSYDLANAAFTIYREDDYNNIEWEILIDAGHGTPQFLLQNHNRIPEAIILTHPHFDHTAGVDWIVQSYHRIKKTKEPYPIYCSQLCWDYFIATYPHLTGLVKHIALIPAQTIKVNEVKDISITGYPVYHGPRAQGAMALVVENSINKKKAIFTGDILCPLFRRKDYGHFKNVDYLFVDSNNRFPYPNSNHWSILPNDPGEKIVSNKLKEWVNCIDIQELIKTHFKSGIIESNEYFDEFIKEQVSFDIPLSIFDFVEIIKPGMTGLVHYGGMEDSLYHSEDVLDKKGLRNWCKNIFDEKIFVPEAGDVVEF